MRTRFLGLALTALFAAGAWAETIYYVAPHYGIQERDSSVKTIPPGAPQLVVTQNGLTFNVFFEDIRLNTNAGFDSNTVGASARARFQDALEYMADVLNETGTLDIVVDQSENDGNGALAFAGTFYSTATGFQKGSTLTRLDNGAKPFAGNEEIACTVDFGFDWNFGTGAPAVNEADFQSVILHELTHGLGFASLSDPSGNSEISPGVFAVYDQFMRRVTGNKVLFSGTPPSFQGVVSDLRSNDLMFFGAQADARYADPARPGLFAPNPFQNGSSLSHWDTGNIVGGAVMEHSITLGEQLRTYVPLEIGALIDLGYTNADDPGATPGNLSVNPPGPLNFGDISLGNVGNQNFTVTNNGGTTINGTASVTGGSFSRISSANFTVAPGASTVVQARFTPLNLGAAAGTLVLTGDPDSDITINLSGTGVAVTPGNLTVSPAGPVNFGNVLIGAQANQNITVQNTGGTAVNATAAVNGAPFSVISSANFTVNPGASTVVQVRFSPVAVGAASRTLTIGGDPDGAIAVTLNGTGTNTPGNLTTTPNIASGINFGDVEEGAFAESSFTLTNNGGSAVSGNASTTGAAFSIVAGAAYTLNAGESVVVRVRFTAGAAEDFTGTLTLTGDPDGAIVAILEGTGIKAGSAACSAVKGQRNTWSLGDALVIALCLGGLLLVTPRVARARG